MFSTRCGPKMQKSAQKSISTYLKMVSSRPGGQNPPKILHWYIIGWNYDFFCQTATHNWGHFFKPHPPLPRFWSPNLFLVITSRKMPKIDPTQFFWKIQIISSFLTPWPLSNSYWAFLWNFFWSYQNRQNGVFSLKIKNGHSAILGNFLVFGAMKMVEVLKN